MTTQNNVQWTKPVFANTAEAVYLHGEDAYGTLYNISRSGTRFVLTYLEQGTEDDKRGTRGSLAQCKACAEDVAARVQKDCETAQETMTDEQINAAYDRACTCLPEIESSPAAKAAETEAEIEAYEEARSDEKERIYQRSAESRTKKAKKLPSAEELRDASADIPEPIPAPKAKKARKAKAPKAAEAAPAPVLDIEWPLEPIREELGTGGVCYTWVSKCESYKVSRIESAASERPYYASDRRSTHKRRVSYCNIEHTPDGPGYNRHYKNLAGAFDSVDAHYASTHEMADPMEVRSNRLEIEARDLVAFKRQATEVPVEQPIGDSSATSEAPKAPRKGGEGKGRFNLFGHPVTGVLRFMGKNGWTFEATRKALDKLGIACADATVKIQLKAGAKGQRGNPAEITQAQAKELTAAAK